MTLLAGTPEPVTLACLGTGLIGLATIVRRRLRALTVDVDSPTSPPKPRTLQSAGFIPSESGAFSLHSEKSH
jgi:hypothetical protein